MHDDLSTSTKPDIYLISSCPFAVMSTFHQISLDDFFFCPILQTHRTFHFSGNLELRPSNCHPLGLVLSLEEKVNWGTQMAELGAKEAAQK